MRWPLYDLDRWPRVELRNISRPPTHQLEESSCQRLPALHAFTPRLEQARPQLLVRKHGRWYVPASTPSASGWSSRGGRGPAQQQLSQLPSRSHPPGHSQPRQGCRLKIGAERLLPLSTHQQPQLAQTAAQPQSRSVQMAATPPDLRRRSPATSLRAGPGCIKQSSCSQITAIRFWVGSARLPDQVRIGTSHTSLKGLLCCRPVQTMCCVRLTPAFLRPQSIESKIAPQTSAPA